jgi:hypothetical protein
MKREKVYRTFIEPDAMVPTWQPGALPGCSTVAASWPLWVDSAIERPLSATSLRGASWPDSVDQLTGSVNWTMNERRLGPSPLPRMAIR